MPTGSGGCCQIVIQIEEHGAGDVAFLVPAATPSGLLEIPPGVGHPDTGVVEAPGQPGARDDRAAHPLDSVGLGPGRGMLRTVDPTDERAKAIRMMTYHASTRGSSGIGK
jgi:hypothetical protein